MGTGHKYKSNIKKPWIENDSILHNGFQPVLQFVCPECECSFEAKVWTIVTCEKSDVDIETDWFDDEYAGMIGTCKTVKKQ